jgi:hypothetical protein
MELNSNYENAEYEIKIFQIDKSFYEFKKHNLQNNEQIINYIINEHRIKVKDIENYNKEIVPVLIDDVYYFTYVYNEEEKDAFWKKFIPESLSNNLVFKVQQLSFAMFASVEDNIYAIVGGGGSRVIIRFQNHRFGLDFFEFITDLNEDVISIETRGISGKLTKRKDIFKDGLKLVDILNFTNIPSKINIVLKEEIKDSVFDFIEFENRITTIEIGSYFNIKHRIPFKSLHLLFKKINEISKSETKKSLTSFVEVKDKGVISNIYREELLLQLYENMMDLFSPARGQAPKKLDIEFVHPSRIQEFYEAEFYIFKFKGTRKGHNFQNRKSLYNDGLKLVYESLENFNLIEFKKIISGLHLYGMRKNDSITHAMFLDHIVCEINIENRPVFQIDAKWFKVENNFTDTINEICSRMIDNNYLNSGIITEKWGDTDDEDAYNRKYHLQNNYWVLDKAIGQNIELCDIMYEDDNTIYFIHVKNGFDAKIRDLSNQIQISASRFMNERNSGSDDFIVSIINAYNSKDVNLDKLIDKDSFKAKFKTGGKNIQFVMAFKSELKRVQQIKNNVDKVQSNIAKYSLIQCVREMNMLTFPIKIVEIEKL